jgi:hypothetical protein
MLEELKAALAKAIRSSSVVTDTIRRIREQGFNLHLVLSFDAESADGGAPPPPELQTIASKPDSHQASRAAENQDERREQPSDFEETARPPAPPAWVPASGTRESSIEALSESSRQPTFRLSGYDVSLLKSLGIDPTRKGRQRRRSSGRQG